MDTFTLDSFVEYSEVFPAWLWVLLAALIIFCIVMGKFQADEQNRLRESVFESRPIPANEFLNNWITAKSRRRAVGGYKLMDQPGCYVILTNPADDENGAKRFDNVYVGQSVKVCSRVRAHLTGHGNGDVYTDVRNGQNVVVYIIPCSKEEMNAREKELIAAFHATSSYNNTHGGARRR